MSREPHSNFSKSSGVFLTARTACESHVLEDLNFSESIAVSREDRLVFTRLLLALKTTALNENESS